MEIQLSVVREIAIPLAGYPHIAMNESLSRAIGLLMEHRSVSGGHLHFDEILVLSENGGLAGQLPVSSILKTFFKSALRPSSSRLFYEKSEHFAEILLVVDEWFKEECGRQSGVTVASCMTAHSLSVDPSAHVIHALGIMLDYEKTMLPVMENNVLQGAVRIEDIFRVLGEGYAFCQRPQ